MGIKDNILLYDQWVPDSQNEFTHIIHAFDLNTGKQSEVSANEVKMENEDYIYKDDMFKMKFQ